MRVSITYCVQWNYHPQAAGLADAIRNETGHEVELVEGGGGIFDVAAGGKLLFSKHQQDRFPTHDEIVRQLK